MNRRKRWCKRCGYQENDGKELVKLCKFLDIDPREFADKELVGR